MSEETIGLIDEEANALKRKQPGHLGGVSVTHAWKMSVRIPLFNPSGHLISLELIGEKLLEARQFFGALVVAAPGLGECITETGVSKDTYIIFETVTTDSGAATFFADWAGETITLLEVDEVFIYQQEVWLLDPSNEAKAKEPSSAAQLPLLNLASN